MTNKKIVMKTMFVVLILIIIIILLAELNWFNKKQAYQKFELERQGVSTRFCEHYYEECVCYGKLMTLESYPPQYQCNGKSFCSEMNETICRE